MGNNVPGREGKRERALGICRVPLSGINIDHRSTGDAHPQQRAVKTVSGVVASTPENTNNQLANLDKER